MVTAKVTAKGQITIPKEIRRRLGVQPGDLIAFVADDEGIHLKRQANIAALKEYRGFLKHLAGQDPDKLVDEMRGS